MDRLETASVGTEAAEQTRDNTANYTINACYLASVYDPAQFDIVSIDSALVDIKNERYKLLIDALPDSVKLKKAYTAAKSKLPAWALNGEFNGKVDNPGFVNSNGLFHIDIDGLPVEMLEAIKQKIVDNCPYLYALWRSPSGRGLKGLIKIPDDLIQNDDDFKKAYAQIELYLSGLGVTIDKSCKDVRRLCFVCSDPDIYINIDAPAYPFDMTIWNQSEKPKQSTKHTNTNIGKKQNQYIERACDIIRDAADGEYHHARCKAGFLAGGFIARGLVNEAAVTNALCAVSDEISARHGDDPATIQREQKAIYDGIQRGKSEPVDDDCKQSDNSGAAGNTDRPASTHNAILDDEQHHCTVDFLQFVDDNHILKQLALSIANATHLPVHTVFIMGLGVFASVACRWRRVNYLHGGTLPIGLYVIAEHPSGTAKSRTLTTFQKPFYAAEKRRKKTARARLITLSSIGKDSRTTEQALDIEALQRTLKSVLFTTNSTPEALEESLTNTAGYFSAVSSEQGLFNTMLGACYGDGRASNNDLLLNGFDAGNMSSKRVGREGYTGTVVGGTIMFAQPGSIESTLTKSDGTGLAERFLLIAEKHNLGNRDHTKTAIIDQELLKKYAAVCDVFTDDVLLQPIEYDELLSLKISDDGWQKIAEYRNSIEHHLADGGRYSHIAIRGAAAKIDMQIMKLSALLHLLENPSGNTIDDKHVTSAIGIANALIEANLKLCKDKGIVGTTAEYKAILSLFENNQGSRTERNILQAKGQTKPFKDFTGNKSKLIRTTLNDMVADRVLQRAVNAKDGVTNYSLAQ